MTQTTRHGCDTRSTTSRRCPWLSWLRFCVSHIACVYACVLIVTLCMSVAHVFHISYPYSYCRWLALQGEHAFYNNVNYECYGHSANSTIMPATQLTDIIERWDVWKRNPNLQWLIWHQGGFRPWTVYPPCSRPHPCGWIELRDSTCDYRPFCLISIFQLLLYLSQFHFSERVLLLSAFLLLTLFPLPFST
jgi:hypothetical protein